MADEIKNEEETTTPEEESEDTVDASGEDTEEESEDESEDAGNESETDIDYKKIAEDERKRREKAEAKLAKDRIRSKRRDESDSDDQGDDEEYDEDKPLTAKELESILARERQETRREVLSGRIKEIAEELAESEDEASAIIAIHSNRTFPEGMSPEDQVREAYFIANGPRLVGKRDELRRSLKSKKTARQSGNENTHRDDRSKGEPKLPSADKAEMQRLGFKWDGKRYMKQLSNGKKLVKDPKTNKTFIES